jgi:hypothetical protein
LLAGGRKAIIGIINFVIVGNMVPNRTSCRLSDQLTMVVRHQEYA